MTAEPAASPPASGPRIGLRILETHAELQAFEELQQVVWPGSALSIDPAHALRAAMMVGGLAIGAYAYPGAGAPGDPIFWPHELPAAVQLVGAVYGFPGVLEGANGPEIVHWSHLLAIHPAYRGRGLGFALKRAQWQMIRRRGVQRILWTYDPLLSRNAYLNLARLGGVSRTYLPDFYGAMADDLNRGLASDRFQVEWWLRSSRVQRRLSRPRLQLDLAHYLAAGAAILNPTRHLPQGFPEPLSPEATEDELAALDQPAVALVEIPADFDALRAADLPLAQAWRAHTRLIFPALFARGYLATDLIHLSGSTPRSFYVLSHGDSTL